MKIDLHCHTDNTVQGDTKRFVTIEDFKAIVTENNIEIVAITNHNRFFKDRYEELSKVVNETTMVWPGIELTVHVDSGERHMIIIASPNYVDEFNDITSKLVNHTDPNSVNININELVGLFEPTNVIYIVHYHDKKKKFNDVEVSKLKEILTSEDLVFLEPTNSTSMGIFLDHDFRSIIGSDVTDWNDYPIHKIPELRLRVDGFESFRLLAMKDKRVVDKLLSKEDNFDIKIESYWDKTFTLYNDINIIFGGKGTGKSILAKEIYDYLEKNSTKNITYYNSEKATPSYDQSIKVVFDHNEYREFSTSDFSSDINFINTWKQTTPTSLEKYYEWGEKTTAKNISDDFAFVNMTYESIIDETDYKNSIIAYNEFTKLLSDYDLIDLNSIVKNEVLEIFDKAANIVIKEALKTINDLFIKIYTERLIRKTIEIMQNSILSKKQVMSIPRTVGFFDYFTERINAIDVLRKLQETFENKNKFTKVKLGEIEHKGEIFLKKELIINPKGITGVNYNGNMGKQKVTSIIQCVATTLSNSYNTNFTENINCLKKHFADYNVSNLNDIIGRKNYVVLRDLETVYEPSKGEKHMLALNNIILENKDIFILDEPTVGLGHEYVSLRILPQILKLVKQGKTFIIVTHDANIGVRSLPYKAIYMSYDNNDRNFYVYEGNPFENIMREINNKKADIKWNFIAQKVLEGGEQAFIERKKIYER